jgi:polysaccharide biosynthesis/export protein
MFKKLRFAAAILCLSPFWVTGANAGGRTLTTSDVVQVTVVNQPELNSSARIEPDGTIQLPYVGRIRAAGLTQDQLRDRIVSSLKEADVVKDPKVLVELTSFGTQVSVMGAVGLPGSFTLDRPTTLLQILARAGGIREDAGAGTVEVRRRGPHGTVVSRFDVKAILHNQARETYFLLQNNDEVYVDQASVYYLYGFVNRPGEFPLARAYTVQEALSAGGGVAALGADWRIELKRRLPDGTVTRRDAGLDDEVQPGDVIIVNERLF